MGDGRGGTGERSDPWVKATTPAESTGESIGVDRRALVALSLGGAVALAGIGHRARSPLAPPPRAGPLALWAADRAAHALVGLDENGFRVLRVAVPAPVALAPAPGGVWVLAALEHRPRSSSLVLHVDRRGRAERIAALGAPFGLASSRDGGAWILEREGGRATAWHVDAARRLTRTPMPAGVLVVEVGAPGELWSACAPCRVARTQPFEARKGRSALELSGVARGIAADRRGAWLLRERPDGSTALDRIVVGRAGALVRAFSLALSIDGGVLAADSSGVWIADARAPRLLSIGRTGRVRAWRADLPLEGVDAILPSEDAGAWLAAGGALLRVDANGRSRPGQGGFEHVVALAGCGATGVRPV